jgi:hypothetical protein
MKIKKNVEQAVRVRAKRSDKSGVVRVITETGEIEAERDKRAKDWFAVDGGFVMAKYFDEVEEE